MTGNPSKFLRVGRRLPMKRLPEDIVLKALMAAALTVGIAGQVQAAERLKLPFLDASLVLPQGWTGDVPEPRPVAAKAEEHDFQVQVTATCRSVACTASLDVCTVKTYDEIIPLYDLVAGFMLFPTRAEMDDTTEHVLAWTSENATVAKPLGRETLGRHSWYTVETNAAPGYKSVLHARTVMSGRYMWVLCRTCATDEHRFDAVRALIASIVVDKP